MASKGLDQLVDDIGYWWANEALDDSRLYISKAEEYGNVDLEIMGSAIESMGACREGHGVHAAIMFYALGKVARAISALKSGHPPSADTLRDLTIYSMMARIEDTLKDLKEIE